MSEAVLDDVTAVACAARGEASGLETLYDRHATAVYSLALRIVRDTAEAEDVTQEVFSPGLGPGRALRQRPRGRGRPGCS